MLTLQALSSLGVFTQTQFFLFRGATVHLVTGGWARNEIAINLSVKKATYLHDFEKDGKGVVIPEYDNEEKTSWYLVWNGLPLNTNVRIPEGFCVAGVGVSLLNSHCDDTCASRGPTPISRIFKTVDFVVPALYWSKQIHKGPFVPAKLPMASAAHLSSELLAAHEAAAEVTRTAVGDASPTVPSVLPQ